MSTTTYAARYERIPQDWSTRGNNGREAQVTSFKSVNADRNRLFQALTLPEYIDAWFVAPGSAPGSTAVAMGADCFLISYDRLEGGPERFVGSYKVMRRSKIQFSWKRGCFDETTSSLVKIRLQGDFGRTTVHLTHIGLEEWENAWYSALWDASLERLANLF